MAGLAQRTPGAWGASPYLTTVQSTSSNFSNLLSIEMLWLLHMSVSLFHLTHRLGFIKINPHFMHIFVRMKSMRNPCLLLWPHFTLEAMEMLGPDSGNSTVTLYSIFNLNLKQSQNVHLLSTAVNYRFRKEMVRRKVFFISQLSGIHLEKQWNDPIYSTHTR